MVRLGCLKIHAVFEAIAVAFLMNKARYNENFRKNFRHTLFSYIYYPFVLIKSLIKVI